MLMDKQWGPWIEHFGHGMPVQAGTLVEVFSLEPARQAKDGVTHIIGVAGVDLVKSWTWNLEARSKTKSLPIDLYRIKRPRGMEVLLELLEEISQPELEEH